MADKKDSFIGGLFLGSLIGGAMALLFTPFTGNEARQKLKEKIDELKETGPDKVEEMKANSQEMISSTVSSIEDGIARITQALEEAKKASDEKRSELEGEQK